MKRYFAALIAAVMMIGMLAAPAMATPEPEPCVPGVEVYESTTLAGNIIEVTKTTVCDEAGKPIVTKTYETLLYWKANPRGGGVYVTPEELYTPAGPFRVCGPARAWDVCS